MLHLWIGTFIFVFGIQVYSEPHQGQGVRRQIVDPMKTYQSCMEQIEKSVKKLNCKIPPVRYAPGFSFQKTFEYWIQFYSARHGIKYDTLNALVQLTQTEEGKKQLVTFFGGLKCAGLPGDPINRKNWTRYLPACPEEPPSSPPWYKDSKWANATYHPGAKFCLRLGALRPKDCAPNLTTWECIGGPWLDQIPKALADLLRPNIPSQQCCYDTEGKFITDGAAAGTPDMIFKTRRVEEVFEKQVVASDLFSKVMKDADAQRALEKTVAPTDESTASIHHYIVDARIITACFPGWPGKKEEDVQLYQSLGWTPYRP